MKRSEYKLIVSISLLFSDTALILAGLCVISAVISTALRVGVTGSNLDEESKPLLNHKLDEES